MSDVRTKTVRSLVIKEVSLVDDPANEEARVVIVKAKGGDMATSNGAGPSKGCIDKNCMKKDCAGGHDPVEPDEDDAKGAGMMTKFVRRLEEVLKEFAPDVVAKALAGADPAQRDAVSTAAAFLKELHMDMQELTKRLEAAEGKVVTLEKAAATSATAHATALAAKDEVIKAKDTELASAREALVKAKVSTPEQEDEAFLKSLPAGARAAVEKSRKEASEAKEAVEKMNTENAQRAALVKAKGFKVGKPEDVAGLLVRVEKGTTKPEDRVAVEKLLEEATKIAAASPLFKALGSGEGADANSAEAQLEVHAKEIQKSRKGDGDVALSYAQAYDIATQEHPDLYGKYVVEKNRAAH